MRNDHFCSVAHRNAHCLTSDLTDPSLISKEKLDERAKYTLGEHGQRERENKCDVAVSDFIRENYKKVQLFVSANHPTPQPIEHYVRAISSLLELEPKTIPIFHAVQRYLEFEAIPARIEGIEVTPESYWEQYRAELCHNSSYSSWIR